jgi:hypothetical protein
VRGPVFRFYQFAALVVNTIFDLLPKTILRYVEDFSGIMRMMCYVLSIANAPRRGNQQKTKNAYV